MLLDFYLQFPPQNIWFDKQDQKERYEEIIRHITEYLPDFVCLQECIEPFETMLLENEVIRNTYFMSKNRLKNWYGVNILSKWPCSFLDIPYTGHSFMARSLLCARTVINGLPLTVSTTHFESSDGESGVHLRSKQMETAYAALAMHSNALIMGDFNYDAVRGEEEAQTDIKFVDLFDFSPPGTLEYTFIPRKERLDRMLLKGRNWKPTSNYFLVGTEPLTKYAGMDIDNGWKPRSLSDHFGIISVIEFEEN